MNATKNPLQSNPEISQMDSVDQFQRRLSRFSITCITHKENRKNRFIIHKSVRKTSTFVKSPSFEVHVELLANQRNNIIKRSNKEQIKTILTSEDSLWTSDDASEINTYQTQISEVDDLIVF